MSGSRPSTQSRETVGSAICSRYQTMNRPPSTVCIRAVMAASDGSGLASAPLDDARAELTSAATTDGATGLPAFSAAAIRSLTTVSGSFAAARHWRRNS